MSESAAAEKSAESLPARKDPVLALVLSVLAPGLGHFYTGKIRSGLLWFFAANLCFIAGLWLAGATIFQWSGASAIPPGSPKPLLLLLLPLPELCNLSATLFAAMKFLTPGAPIADSGSWASVIGTTFSGISGILALLCMVDAWTSARDTETLPAKGGIAACVLSWLIPGLGHLQLRRRFHAQIFFVSIVGLYTIGMVLSGGLVASREKYFYYWAGQILLGVPTIVCSLLGQGLRAERFLPYQDLGLLLATSAGLLNVLVMLSAYSMARGEKN